MKSQQRRHRQQQRRGDYNGTEFKPSSRNDKRRNDFQRRGDVSEQDEQKSMTSKETTKQSQEDDQQKNNGASEDRPPKRQSIQEILTELDKMGISYSPTSSRKELEELLLSSATSTNGGDADDDEKASWRGLWQKTSKVASKKTKSIPRKIVDKAERTAQRPKQFLNKQFPISWMMTIMGRRRKMTRGKKILFWMQSLKIFPKIHP